MVSSHWATRRGARADLPLVTTLIIVINAYVFLQELAGGNRFVYAWSAIPMRITHGHHTITLLTSMFMHASWMHIIGNMVFCLRAGSM